MQAYFEEQKQGQLHLLFNNFKSRLKSILKANPRYLELLQQIKHNNSVKYNVKQDRLFFNQNGVFDKKQFDEILNIFLNYDKFMVILNDNLEKSKKAIFNRKKKVILAQNEIKRIEDIKNKYSESIKKYLTYRKVWCDKTGKEINPNQKLTLEKEKIIKEEVEKYFNRVVKNTPEILLAKQTELSLEDNIIADYISKQYKYYDIEKIEQDFDKKLEHLLEKFKENNLTQGF